MTRDAHNRRTFLHMAVASVACAACSSGAEPMAFGDVSAGSVSALPVGSIVAVKGASACIARDAQGLYAMTLTCTHQGCDMGTRGSVSSRGIVCDCHNSEFDVNGGVVRGPASDPLQHFAVSVDASGNITVHGGTRVDASTRVAVS